MVSISGMTVSLKMGLRFPITGQQGHGSRNIQYHSILPISYLLYLETFQHKFVLFEQIHGKRWIVCTYTKSERSCII